MKSLLLYDFVGLYLAIRCNPNYGYPIASKNEDTCDGCRKYLRWSLKVLTLVIESTFVGHRKYLRFLPIYSPMRFILIPMSLMPGRISRFMLCLTVMWIESPEAKR